MNSELAGGDFTRHALMLLQALMSVQTLESWKQRASYDGSLGKVAILQIYVRLLETLLLSLPGCL